MRHNAAHALNSQIENSLASMTTQLRSAIYADAREARGTNGKSNTATHPLGRGGDFASQVGAELGSVLVNTVGLAAAIEIHLREFRKCTGITCVLTVNFAEVFDLPAPHAETIFEMYGEAMSNVARHAVANRVAIGLTVTAHEVTLVIRDNGIGIRDRDSRFGEGIARMHERADRHNGLCAIAGIHKGGTTVTFSLPIARVL